jgi:single-strand DNA-binding protein
MINKVTLVGHLGADPEVRHLENGAIVGRFSLATNENYKDKDGNWQKLTEWHNVVVWRELAERSEKMLKKGNLVYVEGKIQYRKYTGQDGQERNVTDIVASVMRTLERAENTNYESRFPAADQAPPARNGYTPSVNEATPVAEPVPVGGDDLPF